MKYKWHNGITSMCVVASCLGTAANSVAGDLSVIEAAWTTSVTERQYGPRVLPGSPARPIYFWTKLRGGKASLEALQKEGKLPIKHQWQLYNIFGNGEIKEQEPDQEKVLSAGEILDRGGVSSLVNESGKFTWRTWSRKESVWGGTWAVNVLYATGEPVMCDGKPCRWTIKLR